MSNSESRFLSAFFRKPEAQTPEVFWSVPDSDGSMPPTIAPPSRRSSALDPDLALTLGAVYRSAQIISTVCSDLPLIASRNGEVIETPSLASKPDINRSYTAFVKRTVIDLALHGNAFFLKTINDRGAVTNLEVLDPNLVAVNYDDNGRKYYDVTSNGKTRKYTDKEIKHLRLLEVPGKTLGLGPIQAARVELSNAVQVRNFASNWFDTGNGVPLGTLNTDQELTGEDVEEYISGWYEMLGQGKTAVLSKGLKYEPLALKPEDLQFIAVQQFTKTGIATLFGVPINYLNAELDGNSGFTYSNLSQVNTVFHQTTLRLYLSEIEQAITECLPNRVEVKFDLTNLLKTDEKTRFENYAIAIAGGWMTPEYVAEKEGLPVPPKPEPVPAPLVEAIDPEPQPDDEVAA